MPEDDWQASIQPDIMINLLLLLLMIMQSPAQHDHDKQAPSNPALALIQCQASF